MPFFNTSKILLISTDNTNLATALSFEAQTKQTQIVIITFSIVNWILMHKALAMRIEMHVL